MAGSLTTPLEVALARYRTQSRLAASATLRARQTWRHLDRDDLSGSWERQIGPLLTAVTALQRQAAEGAQDYHLRAIEAQGGEVDFDGAINPAAFAGVAADGRPLDSLLYQPVIRAKELVAGGASVPTALRQAGQRFGIFAGQQVRDAGRVADGLATYANPHASGWYRMLQTPSCARCAILAGKFFRKNQGFSRHPRCDCVHVPAADSDDSLLLDPRKAIEAGQVTGLSQAETRAIADGADPAQVVNAKRGMRTAQVYGQRLKITTEGTTKRGLARKSLGASTPRLMPESIYRIAADRDDALRLLRRNGYLL